MTKKKPDPKPTPDERPMRIGSADIAFKVPPGGMPPMPEMKPLTIILAPAPACSCCGNTKHPPAPCACCGN